MQHYQRLKKYFGLAGRAGIAHDRLYEALKQALVAGEFAPGQKMTVRGLAEAFGTSPMPVREAMRRLVADQALEQRANRSIVVPPLSIERLADLRRVRMSIEGLAAEWAASTISDKEIDQLQAIQARMRAMVESGDATDYLAANRDFHFLVYSAARSGVLLPVIESLWLQAGPYLTIMRGAARLGMGLEHHDSLLAALRSGNGSAARQAIAQDIGEAADIMIRASSRTPSIRDEAA